MAITRLSGGLTPADGADPRTFPAIWNVTAGEIEQAQADITSLDSTVTANGTAITGLQTDVTANGTAIAGLQTDVANRVIKNNRSGQYFSAIAERNGVVALGSFWAFGNGSTLNFAPVTYACELVGMSIWVGASSTGVITLQINKNGTAQGAGYELSITGAGVQTVTFATPLSLAAGDSWTFECTATSGTTDRSTVEAVGYWA